MLDDTMLFEALAMALIEKEMPVNKVGQLLKENPHRIWTIFKSLGQNT